MCVTSLSARWPTGTFSIVESLSLSLLRLRRLDLPLVFPGQGRVLLGLSHWVRGVSDGARVLDPHDEGKRDGPVLTDFRAWRGNGDPGNDLLRAVR